jgi:transposase
LFKAYIHDSTLTAEAVNCLNVRVIGSRLIADKGYINKACKKKLKKSHRIKLIYPVRKNQHVKNTTFELNLLKKRSIVEHFFSWLKNYRKIQVRHDKTIISFEGFIYLASLNILHNKRNEMYV